MKKEQAFREKIKKDFGFDVPAVLFYFNGVRVASKDAYEQAQKNNIRESTGFLACDNYLVPSHSFIQTFGHLAKKNVKKLNEQEARDFAAGKRIRAFLGAHKKYIIVSYKDFPLGLAYYDGKYLKSRVPPKKQREIINKLL